MKIIILIALAIAAFIVPDDADIHINVKPKRTNAPPPRDSAEPRLTYALLAADCIEIRNIDFCGRVSNDGKVFARLNEVDADGHIIRTLVANEISARELLNVRVPSFGYFKIAIFPQGAYCNGIEYDFRYFGIDDITEMNQFFPHSILCQ